MFLVAVTRLRIENPRSAATAAFAPLVLTLFVLASDHPEASAKRAADDDDAESKHEKSGHALFQRISDFQVHRQRSHHQNSDDKCGRQHKARKPYSRDQAQSASHLECANDVEKPARKPIGGELFRHRTGLASTVSRASLEAEQPHIQKAQGDEDLKDGDCIGHPVFFLSAGADSPYQTHCITVLLSWRLGVPEVQEHSALHSRSPQQMRPRGAVRNPLSRTAACPVVMRLARRRRAVSGAFCGQSLHTSTGGEIHAPRVVRLKQNFFQAIQPPDAIPSVSRPPDAQAFRPAVLAADVQKLLTEATGGDI